MGTADVQSLQTKRSSMVSQSVRLSVCLTDHLTQADRVT